MTRWQITKHRAPKSRLTEAWSNYEGEVKCRCWFITQNHLWEIWFHKTISEKYGLFFPGQYPLMPGIAHCELMNWHPHYRNKLTNWKVMEMSAQNGTKNQSSKSKGPLIPPMAGGTVSFLKQSNMSSLTQLRKNKLLQSTGAKTTSFQRRNWNKRTKRRMLWWDLVTFLGSLEFR